VTVALLDRISARSRGELEQRSTIDAWINDYLIPSTFQFGGNNYSYGGLNTTWGNPRIEEFTNTLPGYASALRQSPPAFAAQMVRALVLSQARFTFRNLPSTATPGRQFGNRDLSLLERPWPNATTGELVSRMEWHAGLAGNAFVIRQRTRLRVLRPDWVIIVYGSQQDPDDAAHALDGEIIGYVYYNGGIGYGKPQTILPEDMAHWSPLPDPEAAGLGQSWITPAVREIRGDIAATQHKLTFFANGATPNMVVKGISAPTKKQFDDIVDMLEERHTGLANAYKTLYLTAGADATVVGSDLRQLDFKQTQGAGETRIAVLSRVPAALLGISEGLSGSSLNAGNFSAARRMFSDTWVMPTLQDLAACLAPLVNVPSDAELWFDTTDMTLLREDAKDAAEIAQTQMATIVAGVNGGFEPESVKAAVIGQNMALLKHTGMVSVQLQQPGATPPAVAGAPADTAARSLVPAGDGRAAGVDTHPGGEQLKHYWLHGEGAAKWSTFTELHAHLIKYLSPDMANRTAAEWFHERYGIWPGADLNRVKHGKPPRGHNVGPG
jgi:HK97 family phage portal protein